MKYYEQHLAKVFHCKVSDDIGPPIVTTGPKGEEESPDILKAVSSFMSLRANSEDDDRSTKCHL
jgi:hypothetical protein